MQKWAHRVSLDNAIEIMDHLNLEMLWNVHGTNMCTESMKNCTQEQENFTKKWRKHVSGNPREIFSRTSCAWQKAKNVTRSTSKNELNTLRNAAECTCWYKNVARMPPFEENIDIMKRNEKRIIFFDAGTCLLRCDVASFYTGHRRRTRFWAPETHLFHFFIVKDFFHAVFVEVTNWISIKTKTTRICPAIWVGMEVHPRKHTESITFDQQFLLTRSHVLYL